MKEEKMVHPGVARPAAQEPHTEAETSTPPRLRRIGFTATREGLTQAQRNTLLAWVSTRPRSEGHHGDCIRGDEAFHATAQYHGWRIISHPASGVGNLRAFTTGCAEVREPKPPMERNADIVNETDELVACPLAAETLRSGTWSTVRKARKAGRQVTIIWPDGRVTVEPAAAREAKPTLWSHPQVVKLIRDEQMNPPNTFGATERPKPPPTTAFGVLAK